MFTRRAIVALAVALVSCSAALSGGCGARTQNAPRRRGDGGGAPPRDTIDVTIHDFRWRADLTRDATVDRRVGTGACLNSTDLPKLDSDDERDFVESRAEMCGLSCLGNPDADCARECMRKETGLTSGCARCWAEAIACAVSHCLAQCAADPSSPPCRKCRDANCLADFKICSGL